MSMFNGPLNRPPRRCFVKHAGAEVVATDSCVKFGQRGTRRTTVQICRGATRVPSWTTVRMAAEAAWVSYLQLGPHPAMLALPDGPL